MIGGYEKYYATSIIPGEQFLKKALKNGSITDIIITMGFDRVNGQSEGWKRKNEEMDLLAQNLMLTLAYDGTAYEGWQRQRHTKNTIQGSLEEVFSGITGETIRLHGAGRTDAGVHARGQTAHFCWQGRRDTDRLRLEANEILPPDIRVLSIREMPETFHARYHATGKTYTYTVCTGVPEVFSRKMQYAITEELNWKEMQKAAEYLKGTHNFTSFSTLHGPQRKSSVRTLQALNIVRRPARSQHPECGNLYIFSYTGDGFLYNMIRILTGTLLEIGAGRRRAGQIPDIFAQRERSAAGYTVPPHGLCLEKVYYKEGKL